MEIELQEIYDYLSMQVPFITLTEASRKTLVNMIVIHYLRRGQAFPPSDIDQNYLYLLRSGAIDLRDADGNLFEKMNEGETYSSACVAESDDGGHGIASEDSLLYMIPCKVIQSLQDESPDFHQYFITSVHQRLKYALECRQRSEDAQSFMQLSVSDIASRTPISVSSDTSIANAAKHMTHENVSSILVMQDEQLVGIMSDHDLRSRCVATGLNTELPVSKIMTTELISVSDNTSLADTLLTMTRHQIHHLPVVIGNRPTGMVSVTDLIHQLGANPAFIATDIEKANSVERLVQVSRYLPELQLQLAMANSTAVQIGEVITAITDALTRRLLVFAERTLGPPPVPYVWLAGGSQGRNEQTSHSDQDNALFISDDMRPEHDAYFAALAKSVSDGLDACGYIYCPGNAMATNDRWRQPVRVWRKYFRKWIEQPEKKSLMLSSIFFDLRPVYGEAQLYEEVQRDMLSMTRSNGIFIAFMVSNALSRRPPVGFFRNFVLIHDQEHDHTLDIKHRGIIPIVDIARVYALSEGLTACNSTERLRLAYESGSMSQEMSENLIDSLEYISSLRIQHQAQQIRDGMQADNYIDPKTLSGLERGHLKDAFMIIKDMQEVLESRHQATRMQ